MAASPDGLRPFSQSIFSPPADAPGLVAACPTIDLTASVGGGNAVYIRRRGGEIVSKLAERNKTVQAVSWRSDGQYLAVAWSDGVVRLAGLESTKAVHQIRLFDGSPVAITCISWVKNLVGRPGEWQGSLLENLDNDQAADVLDLPRTLLFLEIEDDLPRLPPLPVSGGSGDDMFVFSTRTSLEFMFPPLKRRDGDAIHVMVLGAADGVIHVSIYDTFVMGTFSVPLPSSEGASQAEDRPLLRLRRHASHPATSTHFLLLAHPDEDDQAVYLAPMDFRFIFSSPLNLSLLAHKTTTFQKLLRYIQQTQVHMQGEWSAARELPSRFLANIQEDLQQERRHKNIDHALRVAVLTGYVNPTLKNWLVDTIAERGHKRWDKAVVGGLENLRDLIHDNLMPALDRAAVALSRLSGLAEFHSNDDIGFSAGQLRQLMDMVSCLILVSRNALALVTAELELFLTFSTWMRSLIVRLALPQQAEEQAEKEINMSMTPVLDYITNHLLKSPLDLHFEKPSAADWDADWDVVEGRLETGLGSGDDGVGSLLDMLELEMGKVDAAEVDLDMLATLQTGVQKRSDKTAKQPGPHNGTRADETSGAHVGHMRAFPTFDFLSKLFSTHADRVLKSIAQSGARHVAFGPLTRLSVGLCVKKAEMTMISTSKHDPEDSADPLVFTAFTVKEDPTKLCLFRSKDATTEGLSTAVSTQGCVLALSGDARIVDFQFLGARLVLILVAATADRNARLVAVSMQSAKVTYGDYRGQASDLATILLEHDSSSLRDGSKSSITTDGLCWVVDVAPVSSVSDDPVGKAKSGPVVRMEVLAPRRVGSDKADGKGDGRGSATTGGADADDDGSGMTTARVCLMHADGTTYRVFSLPSIDDMFDSTA